MDEPTLIDRDHLIAAVTPLAAHSYAMAVGPEQASQSIVDEVILPALTAYLDEPYRAQVAQVVDVTVAMWMAANDRQRDSINRLLAERAELKREILDLRSTVTQLEDAVIDPGD